VLRLGWGCPFGGLRGEGGLLGIQVEIEDVLAVELGLLAGFGGGEGRGLTLS